MGIVKLFSRAKVNLTLEVSGVRADGYHDIDSVVSVIDIADAITVSRAPVNVIQVTCDSPGVPSGRENLVYHACKAFFTATDIRVGAKCIIRKGIPALAGLGGGSGNVAAVVAALDRLHGTGLSRQGVAEIAAAVSSDAALFVHGGTVRMRGRGELIEELPDAPELHLVVVKPDVGVSTAWAYSELDKLDPSMNMGASDEAQRAITSGDRDALVRSLTNDFGAVAFRAFNEIDSARRRLAERGAENVLLAGSGSAVFGVFASQREAERAASWLRKEFSKVFVTRTMTRSESAVKC